MSKNALTVFDQPGMAVPDYVNDTFGDEKNITDRVTVPSLSYTGKVWTIHNNGEKTKVTKRDDDGDDIPVSVLRVVVLDWAKRRGRAYYEGNYDPDKPGAPLCWSDDGVKPHASIKEPQCGTCEGCPMSVKGSKITEQGKAVTACSQHRMIVVAPLGKPDMPLRMKLAITSDWDKQNPEMEAQNWFAFNNYTDYLRAKGVPHTAAVVTKMKFDPNVAYPKVMFTADRWLSKDEAAEVKPVLKSEEVQKLLGGTWTPAGVDGKKIAAPAAVEDDEEDDAPPPPKKAAPKAAAKPVMVEDDDEDDAPPPPKKAAAKKAVQVDDDDDDGDVVVVPPPKHKTQSAPKAEAPKAKTKAAEPEADTAVPDDVKALLSEWGED
jgi:hypothetical protein